LSERVAESLRALRFSTAGTDNFFDWNLGCDKHLFELRSHLMKVRTQDRFGVRPKLHLEIVLQEGFKHRTDLSPIILRT
jgi:hypothetical protein